MRWRTIAFAIEFRIVRLILLEHIVDSRQEHPGNGNNGFLVPPAFLERKIAIADFREFLGTNGAERTLNKQRLDVGSGPADSGGFFLPGAFVVLRRKTSPGAEVLRGGEHGHIHSDFRDDANCGKGLDTRSRHNKIELGKILLSGGQNQRIQIELAQLKAVHVGTDDAELFSLFFTHLSVHGSKDFCVSRFHAFRVKSGNIGNFLFWILQNTGSDCGGLLAEHVGEYVIQLEIGDSQTVLRPVFLPGSEVGKFPAITHQIPKLSDIRRRDKTPGDKIVFEDVGNPPGISFVGFLTSNCFHIFGVSQDNVAGELQSVVNGNPVFPSGFHTHIFAVVLGKPIRTSAQISGESREPFALVSRHSIFICGSDTGNDKRFVDVHPAADGVNDFEHNTSPRNSI